MVPVVYCRWRRWARAHTGGHQHCVLGRVTWACDIVYVVQSFFWPIIRCRTVVQWRGRATLNHLPAWTSAQPQNGPACALCATAVQHVSRVGDLSALSGVHMNPRLNSVSTSGQQKGTGKKPQTLHSLVQKSTITCTISCWSLHKSRLSHAHVCLLQ